MAYLFDPKVLETCSRAGADLPLEAAMDAITQAIDTRYPNLIETGPRKWILNNAGGAMGQMCLLYCSLNEYIMLFGSPIGTEGHSGRYPTEIWDWVIEGEMWCYVAGETQRHEYTPGTTAYLPPSAAKGYRIPDHAFMLEYCRGPITTMLPFGLADSILSTLDIQPIASTIGTYAKLVTRSTVLNKLPVSVLNKLPSAITKQLPTGVRAKLTQE